MTLSTKIERAEKVNNFVMLDWIFNFIKWLFGQKSDASSDAPPISSIDTDKPPDFSAESSNETETDTVAVAYQEIDWVNNPPQYRKRKGLLSYQEREFYRVIRSQVEKEYHILAMVRMADVLWLANETDNRKFFNNQILCKHFDYVLCDKLKFEPVLVIELDDNKHHWHNRWRNDEFKNKACEMAGLPLLRIKIQQEYDRAEIGKKIHRMINQGKE